MCDAANELTVIEAVFGISIAMLTFSFFGFMMWMALRNEKDVLSNVTGSDDTN